MIAVDTNVLIRFLTGDDQEQFKKAFSLIDKRDVFVPDTVILETAWVLRYSYKFPKVEICSALSKLFGLENVHVTNPSLISQAIHWHGAGIDFADAFHLSLSQSCQELYTFDADFISKAKDTGDCKVLSP